MVNKNLINKTPKAFILESQRYEVRKWNEILFSVFDMLYSKHKEQLLKFAADDEIRGRTNIYLSTDGKKITGDRYEIKPGLFIEKKFNATSVVETCNKLLARLGYKDFKIETNAGLYSIIPPINEPLNQNKIETVSPLPVEQTIFKPAFIDFPKKTENKDFGQYKQVIYYGPPGTGKTFTAILLAHKILFGSEDHSMTFKQIKEKLSSEKSKGTDLSGRFSFITFHQSYSYEDFIEGIRPVVSNALAGGQISYHIKDGLFKDICNKAARDTSQNYVLVIDEINRGNISKIFGEMITLLEENKRMGEKEEVTVQLPYSGDEFRIPNNVYIIGTMNSTDKSIALVDIALRRRFHFERLNVNLSLIKNESARNFLESINKIIRALKNPDYEIGHSYFMNIPKDDPGNLELEKVFITQILSLVEEYFFNDWEALATILGKDSIKIEKRKKFVWDEDNGKFEEETGEYDKIYGRHLVSPEEVFKNTKKNLERFQGNTD